MEGEGAAPWLPLEPPLVHRQCAAAEHAVHYADSTARDAA